VYIMILHTPHAPFTTAVPMGEIRKTREFVLSGEQGLVFQQT